MNNKKHHHEISNRFIKYFRVKSFMLSKKLFHPQNISSDIPLNFQIAVFSFSI